MSGGSILTGDSHIITMKIQKHPVMNLFLSLAAVVAVAMTGGGTEGRRQRCSSLNLISISHELGLGLRQLASRGQTGQSMGHAECRVRPPGTGPEGPERPAGMPIGSETSMNRLILRLKLLLCWMIVAVFAATSAPEVDARR